MNKKVTAILAAFLILSLAGCDGSGTAFTTTAATEAPDTRPEAPNLVGLTLEQIEMRYPELSIKTEYRYDESAAKETVLEQSIAAGEKYDEGATFTLVVSGGAKLVEIDDYTGIHIDDAQTLLEKQGLTCDIIRAEDSEIPENCVIRTQPAAREMVEPGSSVICYVSLGSGDVEAIVPDFVGLSIEDATKLAKENNIALTISYKEDSGDAEAGTVLEQGVDPETVVEPNTRVEVFIAGVGASTSRKTTISVNTKNTSLEGEFQLKYYIDGTLVEDKTEVKEISLTKKIEWEVSGTDVHTYSIVVTSLVTGKSGVLYEMEVDFTQDPPQKNDNGTFDNGLFADLLKEQFVLTTGAFASVLFF